MHFDAMQPKVVKVQRLSPFFISKPDVRPKSFFTNACYTFSIAKQPALSLLYEIIRPHSSCGLQADLYVISLQLQVRNVIVMGL